MPDNFEPIDCIPPYMPALDMTPTHARAAGVDAAARTGNTAGERPMSSQLGGFLDQLSGPALSLPRVALGLATPGSTNAKSLIERRTGGTVKGSSPGHVAIGNKLKDHTGFVIIMDYRGRITHAFERDKTTGKWHGYHANRSPMPGDPAQVLADLAMRNHSGSFTQYEVDGALVLEYPRGSEPKDPEAPRHPQRRLPSEASTDDDSWPSSRDEKGFHYG